jgi:cytochrome c-type biogenesis protein CcmH/NrfG
LALIAMGGAVAAAAVIVAVGMTSGDDEVGSRTATLEPEPQMSLPAGHPSVTSEAEPSAQPTLADELRQNIERLEQATEADPGDVGLLLELGDAYFLAQQLQPAARAFERVLGENPESATAKVRLAMVWHAEGDSARAERALEAVLASEPDQQEAHYSLAIITFSDGRTDEAKAQWQAAARIDPGSTIGRRSQSFVDLLDD